MQHVTRAIIDCSKYMTKKDYMKEELKNSEVPYLMNLPSGLGSGFLRRT